jgi:sec-independent protein translocase protein TatC
VSEPPVEMTFFEHLGELRRVLIHSVLACAVGGVAGWALAPRVLEAIVRRTVGEVILLSPMEAFNERLKLSLIIGLIIAMPFVLFRIWSFVVPGLLRRERGWVLPIVLGSLVLFLAGVWCSYELVVPIVLRALGSFLTPSMTPAMQLGPLLAFVYNMSIATGVVFQLPLVLAGLTAAGLVTPGTLLRQWRYALVGTLLVTAIITPGDVVSAQIVLGVPMAALYFVSVGLSWLVWRVRPREPSADRGDLDQEVNRA